MSGSIVRLLAAIISFCLLGACVADRPAPQSAPRGNGAVGIRDPGAGERRLLRYRHGSPCRLREETTVEVSVVTGETRKVAQTSRRTTVVRFVPQKAMQAEALAYDIELEQAQVEMNGQPQPESSGHPGLKASLEMTSEGEWLSHRVHAPDGTPSGKAAIYTQLLLSAMQHTFLPKAPVARGATWRREGDSFDGQLTSQSRFITDYTLRSIDKDVFYVEYTTNVNLTTPMDADGLGSDGNEFWGATRKEHGHIRIVLDRLLDDFESEAITEDRWRDPREPTMPIRLVRRSLTRVVGLKDAP